MKPGFLGRLAILATVCGLVGCGEKSGKTGKEAAAPNPPSAGAEAGMAAADPGNAGGSGRANGSGSGNPLTAPVDYLGAVGAAQRQAQRVADLTPVQQAVQAFVAGEERLPSNLQELVSEGYLPRLPTPPRGSQLAYNPKTGQVKFVPLAAPAAVPAPAAGGPKPPGR